MTYKTVKLSVHTYKSLASLVILYQSALKYSQIMSDGDVYLPSARSTESCDTSYSSSRKEMVVVSTVQPYEGEPRASNESSTFSIKKFFNSLSLPEV